MSKKTNKKTESPAETTQPAYVKELLEKGVAVITGRSRGELDENSQPFPPPSTSTLVTLTTTSAPAFSVFRQI